MRSLWEDGKLIFQYLFSKGKLIIVERQNIELERYTGICNKIYWSLEVELWAECWWKAHWKEWDLKPNKRDHFGAGQSEVNSANWPHYKTIHWGSFWAVFFPSLVCLFIRFLPVLLRYNWYTVLCEFNVYSIMIWLRYIIKWLPK